MFYSLKNRLHRHVIVLALCLRNKYLEIQHSLSIACGWRHWKLDEIIWRTYKLANNYDTRRAVVSNCLSDNIL